MGYPEKEKVLAYIIRRTNGQAEVLLFEHRDYPKAGWQVPAGTIEPGEDVQSALLREVKEESGLKYFSSIKLLRKNTFFHPLRKELHHRSFYQLELAEQVPNKFTHRVNRAGEDEGLVFQYHWCVLSEVPTLAAEQGRFLAEIS